MSLASILLLRRFQAVGTGQVISPKLVHVRLALLREFFVNVCTRNGMHPDRVDIGTVEPCS